MMFPEIRSAIADALDLVQQAGQRPSEVALAGNSHRAGACGTIVRGAVSFLYCGYGDHAWRDANGKNSPLEQERPGGSLAAAPAHRN
jgi:hypothetical protein